jgi:hypothetical protein
METSGPLTLADWPILSIDQSIDRRSLPRQWLLAGCWLSARTDTHALPRALAQAPRMSAHVSQSQGSFPCSPLPQLPTITSLHFRR